MQSSSSCYAIPSQYCSPPVLTTLIPPSNAVLQFLIDQSHPLTLQPASFLLQSLPIQFSLPFLIAPVPPHFTPVLQSLLIQSLPPIELQSIAPAYLSSQFKFHLHLMLHGLSAREQLDFIFIFFILNHVHNKIYQVDILYIFNPNHLKLLI